jgi:hypothetical protein
LDLDVQWLENWTKVGRSAQTIITELRNIGIFNLIQDSLDCRWIFAWIIDDNNHIDLVECHNIAIQVNELGNNLNERCSSINCLIVCQVQANCKPELSVVIGVVLEFHESVAIISQMITITRRKA